MDGYIKPDSIFAKELGFISENFTGYLWKDDKNIWISLIESKNEGRKNLSKLFNKIEELGYKIVVPTALRQMELICLKRKMKKVLVEVSEEVVECYVKNK